MCLASWWRVDVDQDGVMVHNDMFFSFLFPLGTVNGEEAMGER